MTSFKKLVPFLFKVSLRRLPSSKVFFLPCDRKYSAKGSFTEHPQNIKWQKEKQRLLFWENWDLLNFPWGSINRRWQVRWPYTRLKKMAVFSCDPFTRQQPLLSRKCNGKVFSQFIRAWKSVNLSDLSRFLKIPASPSNTSGYSAATLQSLSWMNLMKITQHFTSYSKFFFS